MALIDEKDTHDQITSHAFADDTHTSKELDAEAYEVFKKDADGGVDFRSVRCVATNVTTWPSTRC